MARLTPVHEHNEQAAATRLVATLQEGKSVAYVSDAGTPGISDPGARLVAAARELRVAVPIVVRMEGTNVDEGRRILAESGLNFTVADGMRDAAEKVVRLAQ